MRRSVHYDEIAIELGSAGSKERESPGGGHGEGLAEEFFT